MKKTALIQARMNATRLPGKVLLDLSGKTVLSRVIERVAASGAVDEICVATTDGAADDAIARCAEKEKVAVFRGSETDVLGRYYGAARQTSADVVVRVTADCPLLDPSLLGDMMERFLQLLKTASADYLSNTLKRTYPRGLDAEIFTFAGLKQAFQEAKSPHEREHVTPYFYEHPEKFKLASFEGSLDHSRHRWTLDTGQDYALISAVYKNLHEPGKIFTTEEALEYLEKHPEILAVNAHIEQKKLTPR